MNKMLPTGYTFALIYYQLIVYSSIIALPICYNLIDYNDVDIIFHIITLLLDIFYLAFLIRSIIKYREYIVKYYSSIREFIIFTNVFTPIPFLYPLGKYFLKKGVKKIGSLR